MDNDYLSSFYIRIICTASNVSANGTATANTNTNSSIGIVRAVGEAAELNGIGIHSILRNPSSSSSTDDSLVVITDGSVKLSQVQGFAAKIAAMPFVKGDPLYLPILEQRLLLSHL